ncbi:MAG: hypothetical protein M9887_08765 [Chitinophagales bacterium]|nr:hypothetical protein [Chitinophagales bacterium]
MKSRFFAMAFLALGVVFATACSKDKDDDGGSKTSAFAGTYYGSHDIAGLGLIVVPDTVTVTDNGDGTLTFASQKLGMSFGATVSGTTATIEDFDSEGIQVGADEFYGISVKSGTARLNGNKMSITLNGVTVQDGTVDISVIGGYPLKNIQIKTAANDPFVRQ